MYDVIVLGGGPAGVTAALRASELGASVALVEARLLGGTCTNDGCVPTRVLAKAARLLRDADQFDKYGLRGPTPQLDFPGLMARTQQVVYQIHEKKQLIKHLETSGVALFAGGGPAAFTSPNTIALPEGRELEGKRFILCVGGHPRRLNFPGAEHALTHNDVWSLKELPRSLVIIGAAATGCQLASIFNAFGSRVTLLELAPVLLPMEDKAVSDSLAEGFAARGIQIHTGIDGVSRISGKAKDLTVHYAKNGSRNKIAAEAVVFAVGWPGNLDSLNLSAAGVKSSAGFIPVDVQLRTNVEHIFAAGDITGTMMLVQSASYEARIAVENAIYGDHHAYKHQVVPHGGFTDPEYGSVGLNETEACERYACLSTVVPYAELDRAVIDGRTEGFCKLIISRETGRILGAHVVGEQALEVVQIIAAGMTAKITVESFAEMELAYPTFAAIVGLAARRLAQELGSVPLTAQWRALGKPPVAEWERSDQG